MKKVVCRWVPHNLTEHQKEEHVRINEMNIPFIDVPTRQESKIWVFEDDPTPTMVKRQRAMKKVMYAVFFKSTEGQKTATANWHTTKYLPEILHEVSARGLMLHHVNASSHTARLTQLSF
ncbi:UNVERIFIED_CONTAM: hypothetical protein NCL1_14889 [Trichonephila clavipes]